MTATAWVANRPEYCFNRRSSESGTVSSSSSGSRGFAIGPDWLSLIPKIYAGFLEVSPKAGCVS